MWITAQQQQQPQQQQLLLLLVRRIIILVDLLCEFAHTSVTVAGSSLVSSIEYHRHPTIVITTVVYGTVRYGTVLF